MSELRVAIIHALCPSHDSGWPGKTTCCGKCPFIVNNAMLMLQAIEESIIGKALTEADDALDSLRRCHGSDVQDLCYPARNTVYAAIQQLREATRQE
jgi:hypothetical protein